MLLDDSRGQHCRDVKPVASRIHEKAVVGVLGKALANLFQLILHVETTHTKSIGQRVNEQFIYENIFYLRAAVLAQKAQNSIGSKKIGDSTGFSSLDLNDTIDMV